MMPITVMILVRNLTNPLVRTLVRRRIHVKNQILVILVIFADKYHRSRVFNTSMFS
jgi:hypothetical protein